MSRIGKNPISVPSGVTIALDGNHITVKGPKGELSRAIPADMQISQADGTVTVNRPSDDPKHKALHGLSRTLIANESSINDEAPLLVYKAKFAKGEAKLSVNFIKEGATMKIMQVQIAPAK